jgi:hypothetical protein
MVAAQIGGGYGRGGAEGSLFTLPNVSRRDRRRARAGIAESASFAQFRDNLLEFCL